MAKRRIRLLKKNSDVLPPEKEKKEYDRQKSGTMVRLSAYLVKRYAEGLILWRCLQKMPDMPEIIREP